MTAKKRHSRASRQEQRSNTLRKELKCGYQATASENLLIAREWDAVSAELPDATELTNVSSKSPSAKSK